MTFFRLSLLAVATTLSSCTVVTTAPAPSDFKLSAEALSLKYRTKVKTGDVHLYAKKIESSRDESKHETHLGTGGALLVQDSEPPIQAQAASILVTPEYSEARGKAIVKRNDRLFIGEEDSANIRIEGTEITLEGPVIIREVAKEDAPPETSETKKSDAATPSPKKKEPKAAPPSPQPELAKEKPKAETIPPAKTTQPDKTSSPAPVAKPKKAAPVDRKRLLNLLREPTDR